jgi:hypothetical protein
MPAPAARLIRVRQTLRRNECEKGESRGEEDVTDWLMGGGGRPSPSFEYPEMAREKFMGSLSGRGGGRCHALSRRDHGAGAGNPGG